MKKIKILMAKPGLDGHDRGIKILDNEVSKIDKVIKVLEKIKNN